MVVKKEKKLNGDMLDATLRSIISNQNKIMPGFTSEPVIKFEIVRNW